MAEPLRVIVKSAYEEPDLISVPTLSRPVSDLMRGGTTYTVELRAVVSSAEDFERWRALLGTYVEVKESS